VFFVSTVPASYIYYKGTMLQSSWW